MILLRRLHRWLGLVAGVAFCLLGLSGSLLVFRPELERLARPELYVGGAQSATLGEMQRLAARAAPGLELYRVRLPHESAGSYEFLFGINGRLTTRVYVDPGRLRVLGVRTAASDPFLWLQSLHFDLLAGETGRKVNGAIAASLLLLVLSGLARWFAMRASWAARCIPRWRARPARRNWGLHMAAGFWASPLLLLMSVTALYFAFHQPVASAVYALTRSRPPAPPPRVPPGPAAAGLDDLLRRAQAFEPAARFTLIRLPRSSGQPVTINYVLAGDLSGLGANAIHFHPATGAPLRADRVRDMDFGARLVAAFVPLHFGIFGGLPVRVLWAALGLLPSILFLTGLAIWRRLRSRRAMSEPSSSEPDRFGSLLEVRN